MRSILSNIMKKNSHKSSGERHSSQDAQEQSPSSSSQIVTTPDLREESCIIEVDVDTTYPHDCWEDRYQHQFPHAQTLNKERLFSKHWPDGNFIRFVCMSDTHGRVERIDFASQVPDGDVLLHAGDFTMHSGVSEYISFNEFLKKLPHKIKLVIPGNHELALDPRGYALNPAQLWKDLGLGKSGMNQGDRTKDVVRETRKLITEAQILIDELVEVCDIKIYGLPWLPQYGLFGFGLERGHQLLGRYNKCPAGVDILLSHGPALGFGDVTSRKRHAGCVEMLNSVTKRIKPKYFVSGHIHEGYGVQTDGVTTFINCAVCTKEYKPRQLPIVFDFPLPHPYTREDFEILTLHDLNVTKPWKVHKESPTPECEGISTRV